MHQAKNIFNAIIMEATQDAMLQNTTQSTTFIILALKLGVQSQAMITRFNYLNLSILQKIKNLIFNYWLEESEIFYY
jgi:hypothetical protein